MPRKYHKYNLRITRFLIKLLNKKETITALKRNGFIEFLY